MAPKTWILLFPLVGLVGCDSVEDELDAVDEVTQVEHSNEQTLKAPQQVSEVSTPPDAQLVSPVVEWRYLSQGQAACLVPDSSWRTLTFDDSSWSNGSGEMGYGDGDETTLIAFGPSASAKCITQYFRHTFTIPTGEKSLYSSLTVRILRDDGAAVYLNGVQVVSSNLPAVFNATTPASSETDSEDRFFQYPNIANLLNEGPNANVIAVEVHQRTATNPDLSFNLELVGVLGQPGPARKTVRISAVEATIDEDRPNTRLGLDSRCKSDLSSDAGLDQVCLARWNLSTIPAGAKIRAAHLDTNVTDPSSDRYGVFPVAPFTPWVEDLVTWNDPNGNAPGDWDQNEGTFSISDLRSDVTVANALSTGTKLITLPMTLIADWLAMPETNNGVAFYSLQQNEDALHFSSGDESMVLVVTYDP